PALQRVVLRLGRDGPGLLHLAFPVGVLVSVGELRGGLEDAAAGGLALPDGEGDLVVDDAFEPPSLERTLDGDPRDLLPPGPRLLVAHDADLVVDPEEAERGCPPVHRPLL